MVDQAEGALGKDQVQLTAAKADFERLSSLFDRGNASRQAYDQQSAAVGQLQASIRVDQAALDAAKLNLAFTTVRAPISGRIGRRLIDVGNIVRATDSRYLAEIIQLNPILVRFTVPQGVLRQIQIAQRTGAPAVEVRSTNDAAKLAEGHLTLIDNQIDTETGTIELTAKFENADQALWPGQFVKAGVITGTRENMVAVPAAAVQQGISSKFVYVVDTDASTVKLRDVTIAQAVQGQALLDSGLAPGEIVVTDNQDQLAPGQPVSFDRALLNAKQPEAERDGRTHG